MNRAEMRRIMKKQSKSPTYNINKDQLEQIRQDCTKAGIDAAFKLMIGLPILIIHDKYSDIMKKEVDGKSREERFTTMLLDLYDSVKKELLTFEDIEQVIKDECEITFEKEFK